MTVLAAAVDSADDALQRLTALQTLLNAAKRTQQEAVAEARGSGASWAAVGRSVGLTKQGAAAKWGPSTPKEPSRPASSARPEKPPASEWELRTVGPRGGFRVGRIVKRRP